MRRLTCCFPGQHVTPPIQVHLKLPMMDTAEEIKELLSKDTFISHENCVYLGGPCNVGKSTLASILIVEEILHIWQSTDGLIIYFGMNGIILERENNGEEII